ncbi:MAG: hypothetical protein U5K84_06910 [Alkalibacterium sp.]|nr:hypothetical protein [Alkalibacterium sp.]
MVDPLHPADAQSTVSSAENGQLTSTADSESTVSGAKWSTRFYSQTSSRPFQAQKWSTHFCRRPPVDRFERKMVDSLLP